VVHKVFRRVAALGALVVAATTVSASAPARAPMRLQPEERATLHVGETALIERAKRPPSSLGSAGTALVLVRRQDRRDTRVWMYRAVEPGNQTFVAAPDDLPNGHCISCVTEHYYVTVVP
jgi:hypothetical protein